MKGVVISVMMGRGGSTLPGKNQALVFGIPLMSWGMRTARRVKGIEEFFFTSDDEGLLDVARREGYQSIRRPADLASDQASGCDVLVHALTVIKEKVGLRPSDVVLMQHANSATYSDAELSEALDFMRDHPEVDCVAPAHLVDDYHPFRQKKLMDDGVVTSFFSLPQETSSNRQDLPPSIAFNHSFWVLRVSAVLSNEGPPPWTCMGHNVRVLLTEPRNDVHTLEDISRTENWIRQNIPYWRQMVAEERNLSGDS